MDLDFDTSGLLFENTLVLMKTTVKVFSTTFITQLPFIRKMISLLTAFFILNFMVLIYLRVTDVILNICKVAKMVLCLPIFAVLWQFMSGMYKQFVTLPDKEQRKDKKSEDKCQVWHLCQVAYF